MATYQIQPEHTSRATEHPSISDRPTPDDFRNPLTGQSGRKQPVGWMNIHRARRHREFDSDTSGWRDRGEPGSFDRLKADIARHGIEEPLQMQYDHRGHRAIVGEGNHRLEAAYELGHTAVPVTLGRATGYDDRFARMSGTPEVRTPQKLFERPGDKTGPADVFGLDYRADPNGIRVGRELRYRDR